MGGGGCRGVLVGGEGRRQCDERPAAILLVWRFVALCDDTLGLAKESGTLFMGKIPYLKAATTDMAPIAKAHIMMIMAQWVLQTAARLLSP